MANKDFFIYTDRNKLRTPSNVEYRVDKLLKPKELKSSIKGEVFYRNGWNINVFVNLTF